MAKALLARLGYGRIGRGSVALLLTLFLYVPLLAMARGTGAIVEGFNYVFDTLLYGGAVLLLAGAVYALVGGPMFLWRLRHAYA